MTEKINKNQETFYFWFEKQLTGAKIFDYFECNGKPNIKIVYDIKRQKIKNIQYQDGGKLIKKMSKK